MKFYDYKERTPEDWGYLVLSQKDLDAEIKRQRENPSYDLV